MIVINVGLLLLALWLGWYIVKACDAFQHLRHLQAGQGYRDEAFLFRHVRAHNIAMREAQQAVIRG